MTIKVIKFLIHAKKVQINEDHEIYIDNNKKAIITVIDADEKPIQYDISKYWVGLTQMLKYLKQQNLIKYADGSNYFKLNFDGFRYVQSCVYKVLRFLLNSIVVPIVVSAATTFIVLWINGIFK